LAKTNFQYEKRQRDIEKKRKKEEKVKKKAERVLQPDGTYADAAEDTPQSDVEGNVSIAAAPPDNAEPM
jgi:hypothetical protein